MSEPEDERPPWRGKALDELLRFCAEPLLLREFPGGPVSEVEITPEMVKAGVEALYQHNPDFEAEEDAVSRIYRAMHEARWAARSQPKEGKK